jgi:hypothetical protein
MKISLICLFFFSFYSDFALSNEVNDILKDDNKVVREKLPNYFFDCATCDQTYYRQEINYVNFVRDRSLADIYSLLTMNTIGSGGSEFKLFFIGQNKFKGNDDTLTFQTEPNASEAEIREALLEMVKKGLLKYLVHTDLIKLIKYEVPNINDNLQSEKVKDKWNFWTIGLDSRLNGDANSYQSSINMRYGFTINRTTEKIKTESGLGYGLNEQKFRINDSTTVKGYQSNSGGYHYLVFSLGKHFALGHFATYFRTTPQNLKHSYSYFPAIEYNLFDYKEASRRQLRFIYRAGMRYQQYYEPTIYDQSSEWLYPHSFVVQWIQIEKWGNINLAAGTWHYLNHNDKYSASLYPSINFNPMSGLRIGLWSDISIVNDQFFLKKGDAGVNEILLNQVELKTDYTISYGVSINYTFGSKYNNIINVRFDINDNFW